MKKEMGLMVAETVSKAAVGMAVKVAKTPNQCCLLFLGEPHSDLAIESKDYKNLQDFIKYHKI
ncbi:MAG: hypothetical protein IJF03_00305 [Lachnospiraceae bacterium]|nr:hypothetical protein [Lachnospiraceae bacterium]